MSGLHVFGDDCEWIVARDAEDAAAIWCETSGCDREPEDGFDLLPDDSALSIWCDMDTGKPDEIDGDNCELVTLTCAEWAARLGRGYLGTTEQ